MSSKRDKESDKLGKLAEQLKSLKEKYLAAVRTTLETAIEFGGVLVEAKEAVGHGNWSEWLRSNVDFSPRLARDFMTFYAYREELKSANLANLTDARHYLRKLSNSPEETEDEAGTAHGEAPGNEHVTEATPVAPGRTSRQREKADMFMEILTKHCHAISELVTGEGGDWETKKAQLLPHVQGLQRLIGENPETPEALN
jgi:hypothetical protein